MKVFNKNKIQLIIGIVFLLLLFFGGTFAYISVSTINNFDSQTINTSFGASGGVSLKAGSNLKIDLTNQDMLGNETDKIYYASSSGTTETPTTEVIGTAKVIGPGIFQCNYQINVEDKSTNSLYKAFQKMSTKSANQIILTINGKDYDFNTANLFPLSITGKFANLVEGANQEIKAGFKVINKNGVDQTALAGTDLSLNFTTKKLNCTVTDEEALPTAVDEIITLAKGNEIAFDNTVDDNLRFIGANPNNYIYFNCSDYNNPTADTCEKWRIIGAFNNMKTGDGETKTLYKIIRSKSFDDRYYWDYKQKGVGSSTSSTGSNNWEDSQLMLMLNGVSLGNYKDGYTVSGDYLLDKNNIRIMNISGSYYEGSSKTYVPAATTTSGYSSTTTVDFSSTGLKNDTTRNMIENVVWKLGGPSSYTYDSNGKASHFYSHERGTNVPGNRPTEWTGKIGLIYTSDYAYATGGGSKTNRDKCLNTILSIWDENDVSDCKNNDWLLQNSWEWTISPYSRYSNTVLFLDYVGSVNWDISRTAKVWPNVYLTSNIEISGGEGSSASPYTLKVSTN